MMIGHQTVYECRELLRKGANDLTPITEQVATLLILAIPVASISWTVTHEEVFREPRDWCAKHSKFCQQVFERKFFYLFTCEYCFSHYVAAFFLIITRYKLLFDDWRGYLIAGFSLVWVANSYMSVFGYARLKMKHERTAIEIEERSSELAGSQPTKSHL